MPRGHACPELVARKAVFVWSIPCYRRDTVIRQETVMKWTTPKVVEICVGMEINCYACAEL
jgi:coenzyme PQQ precursor peptide PqqA